MAVILWHNPRCSKSRQALALLQERGHAPQVRLYLKDAPNRAEITALGLAPADMIRSGEAVYEELGLKGADEAALLDAMAAHPILIERPILINGGRAILGRPPERVLDLL